jgi:ferredoxin
MVIGPPLLTEEEIEFIFNSKYTIREAVMKVALDRSKCTGLGICESPAPAFFEVDDNGELIQLREGIDADELAAVEEAVQGRPTEALRIMR